MQDYNIHNNDEIYKHSGRSWVEVDLSKLDHNYELIASLLADDTEIIPVLKANAYGHGALEVARSLEKYGPKCFAVASLDEALFLREHGIKEDILLLSFNEVERLDEAINNDLSFAVSNYNFARILNKVAKEEGKVAKAHIALDTGLSRLGFSTDDETNIDKITKINELSNIHLVASFSHFATASGQDLSTGTEDKAKAREFLEQQFSEFMRFNDLLSKAGIKFEYKHIANSAAILTHKASNLDAVRAGAILYGINPLMDELDEDFSPIMSWKTRVLEIKHLKKGRTIGYDRTYKLDEDKTIAILAVGYADGYQRNMSFKAKVKYKDQLCPVLGLIYMDMISIDISKLSFKPKIGDEIVLMEASTAPDAINLYDLARWQDTSPYTITSSISSRIPRVFLRDGKAVKLEKFI